MSTTYRIAEVADRSGFTPATLRYYEDIGLVTPAARTEAGYRLYDDASLRRLRFVARAKQLGCSLDEIAELSTAWDGGRCAHVQERLRVTVEAKIAVSRRQIAETALLTADLQRAAAALAGPASAGPCDDTCACTTDSSVAAGLPAADDPPVACTLDAAGTGARVEDWAALLDAKDDLLGGVVARRPIDDGVRLEFGAGADVTEIARLAAAEQDCCRFFRFALSIDTRGVALEVRAPADAADIVTALFGAPA